MVMLPITIRKRIINKDDVNLIQATINEHWEKGCTNISKILCQKWNWIPRNSNLKNMAYREILVTLECKNLKSSLPVRRTQTGIAYIDTDFREMKPLASYNVGYFGDQHLHLRYGWQTAFPTALHNLLPHYVRGSVPDWWLAFIWAGLSSLPISA